MESVDKWCKLCLKIIIENDFEIVKDVMKEILDVLLPKENFDPTNSVICHSCWKKSLAAFEFKSSCLYTEDVIFPYINGAKVSQIDLKEIYIQVKKNDVKLENVDEHVCRLCMQLVTDPVMFLYDMELDILKNFVPEMNFDIIKNPVICKVCYESFNGHSEFLVNCVCVAERIKNQTMENEYGMSPHDFYIKTESITIKDEHDPTPIEIKQDCDVNVLNNNQLTRSNTAINANQRSKQVFAMFREIKREYPSDMKLFQCNLCKYRTNHKSCIFRHQSEHTNPPKVKPVCELQMHKCDKCTYQTDRIGCFKRHQMLHKDRSEIEMFKCEHCNYEAKYKAYIKRHKLKHMKFSEIPFYECDECNFKAKLKSKLKAHQEIHKDRSEVTMYKCNECGFETKHKKSLRFHLGKHDTSKINSCKCQKCPFVTWSEELLKKHQTKHSDLRLYECDKCEYKAKWQHCLTSHNKVKHEKSSKVPSEVKMYKCTECDYQTRVKGNVKKHEIIHKNPWEMTMFKCKDCDFESKYKKNLKEHVFRHEKSKFKCHKCPFVAIYKYLLKEHETKHLDTADVQMH